MNGESRFSPLPPRLPPDTSFERRREQLEALAGLEVTSKSIQRHAEAIGSDILSRYAKEIRGPKQLRLPEGCAPGTGAPERQRGSLLIPVQSKLAVSIRKPGPMERAAPSAMKTPPLTSPQSKAAELRLATAYQSLALQNQERSGDCRRDCLDLESRRIVTSGHPLDRRSLLLLRQIQPAADELARMMNTEAEYFHRNKQRVRYPGFSRAKSLHRLRRH